MTDPELTDPGLIEKAADQLHEAAVNRSPCPPVRDLVDTATDIDVGYAIQAHNTERAIAAGRRVSGSKIGITSRAVMEQIGVDQPDFGTLFVDMELGDGAEIPASAVMQPRVEAEVALVLERDLDRSQHSFVDIIEATAYVLPSLEIVDSRIEGWDITIVDTVADNASCGLYVLGGRPVSLDRVDLASLAMSMTINGSVVATGTGRDCLGHPLNSARWLADTMSARGTPLRAGHVLMTGSLGAMRPMTPGDTVTATFGDLGMVSTRLAAD